MANTGGTGRTTWDVIVIGGGPGGLSAALTLVRARRRVLVLDGGRPRNRFAGHMHGVLGHDGKPPVQLLAEGRSEIQAHGGVTRPSLVTEAVRSGALFEVTTDDGDRYRGKRLIVATGLRDELPAIDGLREQWGRGVVACPYCDGYEVRDRRIGVLATSPMSTMQGQLLRQWSADVTYLCDTVPAPEGEELAGFRARGIEIAEGKVARVLADDRDHLSGVELEGGRVIGLDAIFTHPRPVPLDDLLVRLGAERAETPFGDFVKVDGFGKTGVDGVWALGNVANPALNVPMSIGAGAMAAGMLNHELIQQEVAEAVAGAGQPE